MTKTTSEVLNEAADLIEENGWWNYEKKIGMDKIDACCAGTAIGRTQSLKDQSDALLEFAKYLGWHPGQSYLNLIFNWNDSHDTAEPVIAKLREAADHFANHGK